MAMGAFEAAFMNAVRQLEGTESPVTRVNEHRAHRLIALPPLLSESQLRKRGTFWGTELVGSLGDWPARPVCGDVWGQDIRSTVTQEVRHSFSVSLPNGLRASRGLVQSVRLSETSRLLQSRLMSEFLPDRWTIEHLRQQAGVAWDAVLPTLLTGVGKRANCPDDCPLAATPVRWLLEDALVDDLTDNNSGWTTARDGAGNEVLIAEAHLRFRYIFLFTYRCECVEDWF